MVAEKSRAINRLEAMYPIRNIVNERYRRSLEAMQKGKPTAWSMGTWLQGDPILAAMDVEIVFPENYGTVCAATGAAEHFLKKADEEGFPTYMCGYARNCLGYAATMKDLGGQIPSNAPMGGMPKPVLLLGAGTACDARFKWFQALGRYLDTPVWVLEMPHPDAGESLKGGADKHYIDFIVKELREFVSFLERLLGKKMDWDKLDEITHYAEKIQLVWHEVNELRKATPCPMHSRDFWTCMQGASFLSGGDLRQILELYQKLYDEVKHRVDNKAGAIAEEKFRLAFFELPPWHSLGFFDELAKRGWNFVIESWSYHPFEPIDLSGVKDPLERIAWMAYQKFNFWNQKAIETGMFSSFEYPYLEYVKEYKCDGALLHALLTCRAATVFLRNSQEILNERVKVPSLWVEGDIVDLSLFDPIDVLKKAEAFEETMEYYRKVRKDMGFEW